MTTDARTNDPFDLGEPDTPEQQMDHLERRLAKTSASDYDAERLSLLSEDELLIVVDLLGRLANHCNGDEPIDPATQQRLGRVTSYMCSRIYSRLGI